MSRLTGNKPENCSVVAICRTIPTTKLTFFQHTFQVHNLLTGTLLLPTFFIHKKTLQNLKKNVKTRFYETRVLRWAAREILRRGRNH